MASNISFNHYVISLYQSRLVLGLKKLDWTGLQNTIQAYKQHEVNL